MATQYNLNLATLNIAEWHRQDREVARKSSGSESHAITNVASHKADWYGLDGGGQAELEQHCQKLVRESTPDNVKRVMGALAEARDLKVPGAMSIRPQWVEGRICGTRANVVRALAGQPDAWGRFERQHRTKEGTKIVRLYIDLIGHAGLRARELAWAPVAGILTAALLEQAGYRAEIYGVASVRSDEQGKCSVRVLLKPAEAPLDIQSLSRISDPAFMRAVIYPGLLIHGKGEVSSPGYNGCTSMDVEAFEGADAEKCVQLAANYNLEGVRREVEQAIARFQK